MKHFTNGINIEHVGTSDCDDEIPEQSTFCNEEDNWHEINSGSYSGFNTADEKLFLNNLPLFYLKLQANFLLLVSTIQSIIEGFQQIHDIGQSHFHSKLKECMIYLEVPEDVINDLIAYLLKTFNTTELRSDQTLKSYFKTHFNYVAPVKLYLGKDRCGKEIFCQYIPMKETLAALYTGISESSVQGHT